LIGSGISLPAGMWGVERLTAQVLSAEGVIRYAATYVLGDTPNESDRVSRDDPEVRFVHELADLAKAFEGQYVDGRDPDYETIAYLADQVDACLGLEYENAALLPLLNLLITNVAGGDVNQLREIAGGATDYILGIVWSALSRRPDRLDHLAAIADGCRSLSEPVWLVSLNHDTVLEQALRREGITFTDGFEDLLTDEIAAWTDTYSEAIRVVKPHGSVNWYRTGRLGRSLLVRADVADPYHMRDRDGELMEFPVDGRGQILAGTFNKILSYQTPVFAEQILRFHEALREAEALIVIGYGFRDKAISTRVIAWAAEDPSRRLVVLHREPGDLIARARPAAERMLLRGRDSGQARFVERWVEEAAWQGIQAQLE
jgi:SIR2-like domain